ncbi:DedA family protein, partial [Candidatus Peregrinibacteria bacterium]|nr:DedA family protein [Candidatus Peregrinibacteria bacterium]
MLENLAQILLDLNHSFGYFGVFFLMTIESSFVPFPSELVVPPAAYLASKGEMNVILVILFGILGSLVGASINYFLARLLGRPIIYSLAERKWAKFLLINKRKIEKSENYFLRYGGLSTFLGRLVPAVRQLISLPAGFVKMNYWRFLFYTFLGAGFWVIVLALLGYYFGENEKILRDYALEISIA